MIWNLSAGVDSFTSNAFLVAGTRTVVVDSGAGFDAVAAVSEHVDSLDAVILTHTHPDHVGNTRDLTEAFEIEAFGFDPENPHVDRTIDDGETIQMGDHEFVALHTPGHKNDHLCFYAEDPGILFAGDLIFQNGGFGRTDLAEGDRGRLVESIERVADEVSEALSEMHVGHGPSITEEPYSHVQLALHAART